MFLPIGTDAPVYHFPWGTIGLIVVNVICFCATGGGMQETADGVNLVEPWILHYGNGLHPVEWITSVFMHAGFMHLIGNMVFLWSFGLVVEGKLGALVFVPIYLALGAGQCALMQIAMLRSDAVGQLGASAAIFGLIAMALVWAPFNELTFLWRYGTFELSIRAVALLYLALQMLGVWLSGFSASSEVLHLTGMLLGFPLATLMLKAGLVDCEGWDLYSRCWGGQAKAPAKKRAKKKAKAAAGARSGDGAEEAEETTHGFPAKSWRKFEKGLAERDAAAAWAAYERMRTLAPEAQLDEPHQRALIDALQTARDWDHCLPLMEDYALRFSKQAPLMQLRRANVLLRERGQVWEALRLLEDIPDGTLSETNAAARAKLIRHAERLQQEGTRGLAEGT